MLGPDIAQVSSALLGIVSAIQILFRTLSTPVESDIDLLAKYAGWAALLRIEVSRSLVRISIVYIILTIFSLIEELIVPLYGGELFYDLSLLLMLLLSMIYLVKIMIRIHHVFVEKLI